MNYKEVLVNCQGSAVSAILKFMLSNKLDDKVAACFVEGKDDAYYRIKIKACVPDGYEPRFFPCHGRHGVENAFNIATSELKLIGNAKMLFFADKDYDLYKKLDGILYTDYYSIENYYSQFNVVSEIIKQYFNLSSFDDDYKICMDLYEDKYAVFYEGIIKVNAYAYALRKLERDNKKSRTNFDDIKISKFVDVMEFDNYKMKDLSFCELKKIFKDNLVENEDFERAFNAIDVYKLRGKWELGFVVWFLKELKRLFGEGSYNLTKNKITCSFDNIMIDCSNYAECSPFLASYVSSIMD